jgi:ATP-dependent Lon protease
MATAILSAFTGKAVRGDVAMTGEITLRGKVLPIGGLKEKSLAARRLGIKTVIIPYDNQREIEELPAVVQKDVAFIPVKTVKEVFDVMFFDGETKKKRTAKAKAVPLLHEDGASDGVRCLE